MIVPKSIPKKIIFNNTNQKFNINIKKYFHADCLTINK